MKSNLSDFTISNVWINQIFNKNVKEEKYKYNNCFLVFWGVIFHVLLLWGILDANFHSPIIQGLPITPITKDAPAKRLFLFIADGLRFRTFNQDTPPFLKDMMNNKGTWGISHTQVPTESRPGHVAITAGLYEDPSAIFKGWKENPVNFDSIFNQSFLTWAWGSPDIISLFTKVSNRGNIKGESYPAEWQDFNSAPTQVSRLDKWVFDKYWEWLKNNGEKIKSMTGTIIFFHLLGCDTIGHSLKPHSQEYIENINFIDKNIKDVVEKTEDFFGEGTTAYVFTADHGMTDWGSHGSGSSDETETPLIVWGAGVNSRGIRHDVKQADIAPLISALIGIPIPTNNEGILPHYYFDHKNKGYALKVLVSNIEQLKYQVKENQLMSCSNIASNQWEEELNQIVESVKEDLDKDDVINAFEKGDNAILLLKKLLSYFRLYQRGHFLFYVTLMWFGWMTFLFLQIIGTERSNIISWVLNLCNLIFIGIFIVLFQAQLVSGCKNWRLLFYQSLALVSIYFGVRCAILFSPQLRTHNPRKIIMQILEIIFLLIGMFMGLTKRWTLSVILLILLLQRLLMRNANSTFLLTTVALAVFPLLPVVEPYPRVYIVQSSIAIVVYLIAKSEVSFFWKIIEVSRLIITAIIYLGLIDGRQGMSWFILLSSLFSIWTYPLEINKRLKGVALSLFCPFVLLSSSYEPLFFIILSIHLLYWPHSKSKFEASNIEYFIRAATFMLYTLVCFFGTGNMASISSFDPSWTRHFVTVFSPFTMFSLILFKICLPLILLGSASHILGKDANFLAVLLLGDCLSLPFMYYVTPQGSWLDIGSTISRFVIAVTLPCLVFILQYLSHPLMRISVATLFNSFINKSHIV
ncbi:GPI ethanolamine phosphate transferase 1 [Prorops nasuta]|uniref:GPI ethanolamine phosphate transferase 1 n=1 Tax=Prorops nasuta TaxID=863751 RepID=UPI0034CE3C33